MNTCLPPPSHLNTVGNILLSVSLSDISFGFPSVKSSSYYRSRTIKSNWKITKIIKKYWKYKQKRLLDYHCWLTFGLDELCGNRALVSSSALESEFLSNTNAWLCTSFVGDDGTIRPADLWRWLPLVLPITVHNGHCCFPSNRMNDEYNN